MKSCNGNGTTNGHHHRWKTVIVNSGGSLTQRCECKTVPECRAVRQMSPDGYCVSLRQNPSLETLVAHSTQLYS